MPRSRMIRKAENICRTMLTMAFLKWLTDLFTLYCPDCGGALEQIISPISSEPNIYVCKKCGKEWV
jgi:predicted RNA-binding Zn-ribbon protein involved in translation (DUF1610 family)